MLRGSCFPGLEFGERLPGAPRRPMGGVTSWEILAEKVQGPRRVAGCSPALWHSRWGGQTEIHPSVDSSERAAEDQQKGGDLRSLHALEAAPREPTHRGCCTRMAAGPSSPTLDNVTQGGDKHLPGRRRARRSAKAPRETQGSRWAARGGPFLPEGSMANATSGLFLQGSKEEGPSHSDVACATTLCKPRY